MDFDTWDVDLKSSSAIHISGFKISVEGDLKDPVGVHPDKFPEVLSGLEQARLLRSGLEAIVREAQCCDLMEEKDPVSHSTGFFHWLRSVWGKS